MPYGDVYMHFLQKIRFSVSFSCSRTELYGTDSTEEWCTTTTLYGKLDQHNKWRSDSHLNQRVAGGFIGEECDYRRITWGGSLIGVNGSQMQSRVIGTSEFRGQGKPAAVFKACGSSSRTRISSSTQLNRRNPLPNYNPLPADINMLVRFINLRQTKALAMTSSITDSQF